jgi:hypothetical protein
MTDQTELEIRVQELTRLLETLRNILNGSILLTEEEAETVTFRNEFLHVLINRIDEALGDRYADF